MTVKPNKIYFDEIVWNIFLKKWSKTPLSIECRKKKYQTKRHLNDQSKNKVHNITNWWEFKLDKIIACEHARAGQRKVGNLSPSWARAFPHQQESERNARPGERTRPPLFQIFPCFKSSLVRRHTRPTALIKGPTYGLMQRSNESWARENVCDQLAIAWYSDTSFLRPITHQHLFENYYNVKMTICHNTLVIWWGRTEKNVSRHCVEMKLKRH